MYRSPVVFHERVLEILIIIIIITIINYYYYYYYIEGFIFVLNQYM